MWEKIRLWLKAPVFEDNEEKTRQASVIWIVAWTVLFAVPAYLLSFPLSGNPIFDWAGYVSAGLMVSMIVILIIVRLGYVRAVGYIFSFVFWAAGTIAGYQFAGLREITIQMYYLVLVLAGTTIGVRAVIGFFGLSVISYVFLAIGEYRGWIEYNVQPPTSTDDIMMLLMIFLVTALLLRNALRSLNRAYAETQASATALGEANAELQSTQDALAQQSADLQRRAIFLEATTNVAQATEVLMDQPELLFNQIVESIGTELGMYHVGLYFLAPGGEYLQLVAASSEAGKTLIRQAFQLPASERAQDRSIAGWVALRREVYVTNDVDADPRFRVIPDLIETRSEIAMPLLTQGKTFGVLDLQSTDAAGFSDADVISLQVLADQVSMTIRNAQLVNQLGEAIDTQRRLSGEVGRENWLELIRAGAGASFVSDEQGVTKAGAIWQTEMQSAVNSGAAAISPDDPRILAVPVRARGEVVAVIDAVLPESMQVWTPASIAALEAMAEQLGTALEGARLYQQTRERAATEQMTREVTAAMRSTLDVDGVLQAALREISKVLQVQHVQVRLGTAQKEASA